MAGRADLLHCLHDRLRVVPAAPCNIRVAHDGIHRRPDVVGHVCEEIVAGAGLRLRHSLLVLCLSLHLGVDVVRSDYEMLSVVVLHERRLHADEHRGAAEHQAVLHREAAVPLQDRHDPFLFEDGHETLPVSVIDEALHVFPAGIEKVPAFLFDLQAVEFLCGAVLKEVVRHRIHDVDAEIVPRQGLGHPGVRKTCLLGFRIRLPGFQLFVDVADADDHVPCFLLDHPGDLQTDIHRPLPEHHPEGHGEIAVLIQGFQDVLLYKVLQKVLAVVRVDDLLKIRPGKGDDVVPGGGQPQRPVLRRSNVLDKLVRAYIHIIDAEIIRGERLSNAGLRYL